MIGVTWTIWAISAYGKRSFRHFILLLKLAIMSAVLEPFTIPSLTQEQKDVLKSRLSSITWPQELDESEKVGWSYGAPTWAVKRVADHWLNKFDWEKERAQLNEFHHYKMNVDGLKVHLIHEPSSKPGAKPLVLIHGWPGSFCEFKKVIAPLRDGAGGKQVCSETHIHGKLYIY